MQRLAVYTSIDGKIHTEYIKIKKNTNFPQIIQKIPQGRVTLVRHLLYDSNKLEESEIWIEIGKEFLLRDQSLIQKAFEIYSEDIIYESCFKI